MLKPKTLDFSSKKTNINTKRNIVAMYNQTEENYAQ